MRKGDREEKVGGLRMQMERWDRETSDERMIFAPGLLHADSDISIYCFHSSLTVRLSISCDCSQCFAILTGPVEWKVPDPETRAARNGTRLLMM